MQELCREQFWKTLYNHSPTNPFLTSDDTPLQTQTLNPNLSTQNLKPSTLNSQPSNPQPLNRSRRNDPTPHETRRQPRKALQNLIPTLEKIPNTRKRTLAQTTPQLTQKPGSRVYWVLGKEVNS